MNNVKLQNWPTSKFHSNNSEIANSACCRVNDGKVSNPRKVRISANLKQSAIVSMYLRKEIDEAQRMAAERFRALVEMCSAGTRSMDYSKVRVDGSRIASGFSDEMLDAHQRLQRCYDILNAAFGNSEPFELLRKVTVDGKALSELRLPRRATDKARNALKMALSKLAEHWGLASRTKRESNW